MSYSDCDPGTTGKPEFDRLYRSSRDPMIRLARLLTGSTAVAEEMVQEALLRIYQRKQPLDNPEAFLRVTVTNLCKNHLRRLRLERSITHQIEPHVLDPEIDQTWEELRNLPFRQRSVIVLRFYEDLGVEEIAHLLGCRVGTVKSRLHRGLEKLRSELS